MHIALLTYSFPPQLGGVQTYLYETMCRVAEHEKVTVVTPISGEAPGKTRLKKYTLANGRAPAYLAALRYLKPDKVLVGHAHPQLLLPAWLYTRGHYVTITYGNDYLAAQQRWHRPLFNWLLGRSQPLITITHANAQRLKLLGLPMPQVIYPGTDATHFAPAPLLKSTNPTLLTVSRLVSRKGIDTVLRALPHLRLHYPHLRYEIVGDGPEREQLQDLTTTLGLAECVTFLGKISDSDMLTAYRRAHIFVMPAREENASIEGFGIVYLEASACGLPVVAGRSGGAIEAVQEGITGLLVDPNQVEALADVLHALLRNPTLMKQLGENGRAWVQNNMNWDRAAQQLHQILV